MDKLLILGGTNFIGRNLVEKLIALDCYDITLLNRGLSNPHLFPDIKKIHGDRNDFDLSLPANQTWDYVIDLSCFYPKSMQQILDQMGDAVKRYVFISTCSVYDNTANQSILRNESSPILGCTDAESTDTSTATYGNRKAACERILTASNLAYSILRPALVYGPYDNTDRFYYWLYQTKKEKRLLVPNNGTQIFSVTYVNDLVQAIIKSLNTSVESGIYNVTSFPGLSISKLIEATSKLLDRHPKLISANSAFLTENQITQWTDLPLWLDCDYFTYDNSKAVNTLELKISDFSGSIANTIAYFDSLGWPQPKFGMSDTVKNVLIEKLG